MTNKSIKLNVWKENKEFITAVQGEVNSRFLIITLEDDTGPIDLTDKTVKFLAKKPDGTVIFKNMTIDDPEKGTVILELTAQMSVVAGLLEGCEIHITSENNEVLIAKKINIFIQPALGQTVEESLSDLSAFQEFESNIINLQEHLQNTSNPHSVTAGQVGALPSYTKYGATLGVDGTDILLKDQDNNILGRVTTPGTHYTAGENITISSSNVINAQVLSYSVATTSTNGLMSASDKVKLESIENDAEANVQSDWLQIDLTADDYIKNKPTIPTTLSELSGTLPITRGGTGAMTASTALTNLGAASYADVGNVLNLSTMSKTVVGAINELYTTFNSIIDGDEENY